MGDDCCNSHGQDEFRMLLAASEWGPLVGGR